MSDRIKYELQQCEEEGNDVLVFRNEWNKIQNSELDESERKIILENLYKKIENYSFVVENEHNEPSEWDKIIQICNLKADSLPSFDAKIIDNKILGGWLGRSAGCLLGKPIEKIPRSGIKELLSSNNTWPI
ncbi:MAG: ADP-ribosylglycohydrolase family protein, partial [Ignavibacterium sp.]